MNLKKERLQKWLGKTGLMSRRLAEKHITEGRLSINGKTVTQMGVLVDPIHDQIMFDGQLLKQKNESVWIALYKPINYITSKSDPEGRPTVMNLIQKYPFVHPIGRLDYDSEGLLLFTNDGEWTYILTHPKFEVIKKYHVLVEGEWGLHIQNKLLNGVHLRDGFGKFHSIQLLKKTTKQAHLEIEVTEGRNRFIRRMLQKFQLKILQLKRIQMGPILLKKLKPKEFRLLTASEIQSIHQLKESSLK